MGLLLSSAAWYRQGGNQPGRVLLTLMLLCASLRAFAVPYVSYDPRAAAMGGAAVALSDRYAAVQNMALSGRAREFVDWTLSVPDIGWEQSRVNEFKTELQGYQADSDQVRLLGMDGKTSTHHDFITMVATVPSDIFGGGLYLLRDEYSGQRVVVDASDTSRIEANSYVEKRAVDFTEHGVGFAQYHVTTWGLPDNIIIGFVPKLLLVRSTVYQEPIASAGTGVVFSGDDTRSHSSFNLDMGILKEWSRFSALGLSVRNILPMEFRYGPASDARALVNPQVRMGFAYERRDRTVALDMDLTSNPEIAFTGRSRYVAFGGEIGVGDYLALRAGMKINLLGEQEMVFTGGLGLDIDGHRIDVAVQNGQGTVGASAHLNIQF